MANALFTAYVNNMLTQAATQVDLDGDSIRAILVDHGVDAPVVSTDDFLDDIGAGARIAVSSAMTVTISGRVVDMTDVTFTAVTGASVESIVIYKHTGTDSTSRLIAYIDTATNLPVTPNGGDITITWDNGANKVFAL
jgi:hypothetical protein